uniref:Transcriptional coactivator p15 (PC4) C-terminal domain-containing protein n=1 Tax=Arion vulgaris TaxID=1028688 RepID=A0A0B7AUZ0_9EUPU
MPKSKEFLSSSDSESGDSDEPKQKKKKPEAKPEKKKEVKEAKSDKDSKSSSSTKGPGGEHMFQLAKMRYATVSEFRGKAMVGIREYYEKDGELRPGKKGISLSTEQWQALKDKITDIDECLSTF